MTSEEEQFEFLKKIITVCYTEDNDRGKGMNIKNDELKFTINAKSLTGQRIYFDQ